MAGKETENILQSDQKNLKLKSHGQVRLILKSEIESRHENQQHINCEECKSYKSSSIQEASEKNLRSKVHAHKCKFSCP